MLPWQGSDLHWRAAQIGAQLRGRSTHNGVLLGNARAMGEFGAVAVVSGHVRGQTMTMPLQVEALFNDYDWVGAFTIAALLSLLALVTLAVKAALEWRLGERSGALL